VRGLSRFVNDRGTFVIPEAVASEHNPWQEMVQTIQISY